MDDNERYEIICKLEFKEIKDKLDTLNKGLFKDNGGRCLQSRINATGQSVAVIIAVLSAIGLAVLGIIAYIIQQRFSVGN